MSQPLRLTLPPDPGRPVVSRRGRPPAATPGTPVMIWLRGPEYDLFDQTFRPRGLTVSQGLKAIAISWLELRP
jgi:hypothetical protein